MERRSHERRRTLHEIGVSDAITALQWSAALTSGEGRLTAVLVGDQPIASMERRSHEQRRDDAKINEALSNEASMERRSHEQRRRTRHGSKYPSWCGFNGAPLSRAAKVSGEQDVPDTLAQASMERRSHEQRRPANGIMAGPNNLPQQLREGERHEPLMGTPAMHQHHQTAVVEPLTTPRAGCDSIAPPTRSYSSDDRGPIVVRESRQLYTNHLYASGEQATNIAKVYDQDPVVPPVQ